MTSEHWREAISRGLNKVVRKFPEGVMHAITEARDTCHQIRPATKRPPMPCHDKTDGRHDTLLYELHATSRSPARAGGELALCCCRKSDQRVGPARARTAPS
jgi:hypothetical protein